MMLSSPTNAALAEMRTTFTFHHVGCAVKNIDQALAYYTSVLGLKQFSEIVHVASQKVNVCMLELGNGGYLELVQGVGEDSSISKRIESSGAGPYHLCFQVDELGDAIKELAAKKFHKLRRFEMPLADITQFAFLLTPDRQLIELCQA